MLKIPIARSPEATCIFGLGDLLTDPGSPGGRPKNDISSISPTSFYTHSVEFFVPVTIIIIPDVLVTNLVTNSIYHV